MKTPKINKKTTRQNRAHNLCASDLGGQVEILKNGGVGILPTDTLYGLVGSALSKKAVERIYELKKRSPKKPMIILIGSLWDLETLGVRPRSDIGLTLKKIWPGKVSVVLPCPTLSYLHKGTVLGLSLDCPYYLHRGTKTLAFRLPKPKWLRALLKKTGPLVAPSANPEGEKPAETIAQAKKYFGTQFDFYVDVGKLSGKPSTLIAMVKGRLVILRQGAVKINPKSLSL